MKGIIALLLSAGVILTACGANDAAEPDLGMQDSAEDQEERASEDEDGIADGDQTTNVNDGHDESGEDPDKPQDRDGEEGAGYDAENDEWHDKMDEMKAEQEEAINHGVMDFELEIEFENNQGGWRFEYAVKQDGKKAEVEIDQQPDSDRKGKVAIEEIESIIDAVQPTPDLSKEEAFQRIYHYLEVMEEEVHEIELDVDFKDGDTLEVEENYS